jgi:error-prone DNA polymerase
VAGGAPYAELHCHSNFSFLDGASHPDELVEEAARLGLAALAITDHDGMYGVVRFAEAAVSACLPTVFGAEVTLGLARPQTGVPDPEGTHLVVLARDTTGYSRLCKALSAAHLLGRQKGRPLVDLALLAAIGGGAEPDLSSISMSEEASLPPPPVPPGPGTADHWLVLTGCRKGPVPAALVGAGPSAARAELARLQQHFGSGNVAVEIWDHGEPLASARNDALVELACRAGADVVATNNVHYHRRERARLATAIAAVRGRRSLDDMDGWLPPAAGAHLRSGAEQYRRFARYPGAVERAAELGLACAFDLELVAPRLPPFPTPPGHTEATWLRHLTEQGARHRYGTREAPDHPRAYAQIDYELDMIDRLGFAGYFLIVWDIVNFCNSSGIYCQGRGSAANSAVCYALGITRADAVGLGLLFERFLSPERDGPPDIDVDIESERREEAIQYVYRRYGRAQAAQVANVITYRPRSAVRDMGKALGASQGQVDAWARCLDAWGPLPASPLPAGGTGAAAGTSADRGGTGGADRGGTGGATTAAGPTGPGGTAGGVPGAVLDLARETLDFPRHLGIHSGGMVICDRPVAEVCPVEWARMADRSVLQWDKEDCARIGLVKFDMLGLGMLSALHATVDHIKVFYGTELDLAALDQDTAVYEMLCKADSVGVFQVESRAQMATLPRLRPRTFYDLVIEVALIRPGPIQGRSVHPYLRRRNGTEPITYLHPLLERSLAKTLGIPLFQEQLMQMAIDVAGFSAAEADQLRQAMGAKRSAQRMERLRARFYAGMAERGATGPVADQIWQQMAAFANFGFPESHSVSFAYLVYASAWLKLHYPAAFLAGLLDSQPMGFWSPQSLVLDARRHGVRVRRPDVNASAAGSLLEPAGDGTSSRNGNMGHDRALSSGTGNGSKGDGARNDNSTRDRSSNRSGRGSGSPHGNSPAVRLGISYVRTIGPDLAEQIAAGRPYRGMEDVVHRCGLSTAQAEALATAGAFECFGLGRREALWAAGAVAQANHTARAGAVGSAGTVGGAGAPKGPVRERHRASPLPGLVTGTEAPLLPGMSPTELNRADLWATGLSPDSYPTELSRRDLKARGVATAASLSGRRNGARVTVGGLVTHRQRPMTANGVVFVNLEDETGLVNVICPVPIWQRYGQVARSAPALLVRGKLEKVDGAVNVLAASIEVLPLSARTTVLRSRDFH